jgi:hypothetical protein
MSQLFGVILTIAASASKEITNAIGKIEIEHKTETIYSLSFLNHILTALVFVLIAVATEGGVNIHPESWIYLGPRLALDIAIVWLGGTALGKIDRSTFGFFHLLTIPGLLIVDAVVGYAISLPSYIGIALILGALGYLFIFSGINTKNVYLVVVQSILAVITLSLFKYSIENYNTIASEQAVTVSALAVIYGFYTFFVSKENWKEVLFPKRHLAQATTSTIATMFGSYAYYFGVPSVITTVRRAGDVIVNIISGKMIFHETHLKKKLGVLIVVIAGLVLLAIG